MARTNQATIAAGTNVPRKPDKALAIVFEQGGFYARLDTRYRTLVRGTPGPPSGMASTTLAPEDAHDRRNA